MWKMYFKLGSKKEGKRLNGSSAIMDGVVCQPASGEETEVVRRESFLAQDWDKGTRD
jgi:hypothetical protein